MNHARFFRQLLSALLLGAALHQAGARTTQDFDAGWRFRQGDFTAGMMPAFADQDWQPVTLPHDWSSDGPFCRRFGSGNGYAPGGIGWYRKHFQLAAANGPPHRSPWNSTAFMISRRSGSMGSIVGGRPYGFCQLPMRSDALRPVWTGNNVVAVRVDHSRFADSRYYTGSGIYRNVRLVVADQLAGRCDWGVAIVTRPKSSAGSATVRVADHRRKPTSAQTGFLLETDLIAPDGSSWQRSQRAAKFRLPERRTPTRLDPTGLKPQPGRETRLQRDLPRTGSETDAPAREIGTGHLRTADAGRWRPTLSTRSAGCMAGGGRCGDSHQRLRRSRISFNASRGFFLNGNEPETQGGLPPS